MAAQKIIPLKWPQKFPVKVISIQLKRPAAYNYAMKIAHIAVLGFIDADAKVESQWLQILVPHLDEPQVAGVSGSIETWNADNPWARSIGYELKNRYRRIGKYTGRIATMNLLLKKAVIEEVGGWDENLPSQYDTDLGLESALKATKLLMNPKRYVTTLTAQLFEAYYRQQLQYGKNTLKLYFKHGHLARGDEITDLGMNVAADFIFGAICLFPNWHHPAAKTFMVCFSRNLGFHAFLLWLFSGENQSQIQ